MVKVDDHVFHVPKSYLIEGTIPWLPSSQSAGLKFLINPGVRPEEQMIVTIESSATTCHPKTPPVSSQLSTACSSARRNEEFSPLAKYTVEKVIMDSDPTQWEYRLRIADGNLGSVVASCYLLSEKKGLCTALGNYGDLVYSLGLRDEDMPRLAMIHKKIHDLLRAWERAGSL
ncbi:hypothetical protein [Sphingomonas sp. VNH70]|uniref:hypothetical protein n=1 Tax=Sphingomonas silueang TaxID=3156617 RepID=UPI0032B59EFF